MSSLIPADADFLIYGVLLGAIAFGMWAEQKTGFGRRFTGIVIMMTLLSVLSNVRLLPFNAPVYDNIFSNILPVAIPLLLFRADLRQIIRDAGPTGIAFVIGAVGVVAGVILGVQLVPLGEYTAELAGVYTATYIGGSLNFSAVALAFDFNEGPTMTAALATDVVAGHIQTMIIILLPGLALARRYFITELPDEPAHGDRTEGEADAKDDRDDSDEYAAFQISKLNLSGLALALAVAYFLVWMGGLGAAYIERPSTAVLFTSAFALVVANLFPGVVKKMSGDFEAGTLLIFMFLAAIAASADVWTMVAAGPTLFIFVTIVLTVHMIFLLGFGRMLRIPLPELVIGSAACVGGVTSASAIASAKGWRRLVTPGIMMGTFGNATGTFIGVWVGSLFT